LRSEISHKMKTFFDSSSFAKRFIEEEGSKEVDNICQETSQLGICVTCLPEIISALNRRLRERAITPHDYSLAKDRLLEEIQDIQVIQLLPVVIVRSTALLESNVLRAMDSLHLACAVEWNADLFVSSDKAQIKAAKKSGLKTKSV